MRESLTTERGHGHGVRWMTARPPLSAKRQRRSSESPLGWRLPKRASGFCYVASKDASYRGSHSFVVKRLPNDTFESVPSEGLEGGKYAFVTGGTCYDFEVEKNGFDAPDAREEAV